MIYYWLHLSHEDFSQFKGENPWVIIPIGSIEQHGPHLPVGTDSLIVEMALQEASKHLESSPPLLIFPTTYFGKSVEHQDYIGTVSISARTLLNLLDDMIENLARHDLKRIIIVNSHGGNIGMLDGYLQDLTQKFSVKIYAIQVPQLLNAETIEMFDPYDMHAGYVETSLLLAQHPGLVNETRIPEKSTSGVGLAHLQSIQGKGNWGWKTGDLTPNGVIGQPQLASVEAGRIMLTQLGKNLSESIQTIIEP